ncbi:hypothetical protein LA345_13210 [Burkholderia vietnamiensis]|uniref:Uncharacterized protein n=1 Tax=Burkholderia vietnamiensis (strain G4 / LMG 22486) TaxID=269482 RepID=A4JFQ9_BURVG|nr:hypothetical protein Bcep1808_2110 [Burkholderia vietnamiensis G4]MCB4344872.1 hypothetical protein [Burkholderia vietnamiensis]
MPVQSKTKKNAGAVSATATAKKATKVTKTAKPSASAKSSAKSGTKTKPQSVVGKIVRAGVSPRRAASRADAVGRQPKDDPAPTRRKRALSQVEAAQLRWQEAEEARDELPVATKEQILDFQLDFIIDAGMLLFTEDPVVLASARSDSPEPDERLASFLERTFGTRKPNAMIARFVPISDFKGNNLIRTLIPETAGVDVAAVIDRAKARADERVEETADKLRTRHKQRVAAVRAERDAQQAHDARRLAEYPGEWLFDHASELADVNGAAGGQTPTDERVVRRLFEISSAAREHREANPDGDAVASVELVVGQLIEAYNGMAQHEHRRGEEDKRRIRELEAQVAKLQDGDRPAQRVA